MTVTIEQIQGFLEERKVHFFTHPGGECLLLPYRLGPRLSVKVLLEVECEGNFLQISCSDLPVVEASHPLIGQVQQCLLAFNHAKRFVKFAHDPADGEITAAGDVWVEDMLLTEKAFARMMGNFIECVKEAGEALAAILENRAPATAETVPDDELADTLRRLIDLPDEPGDLQQDAA